MPLEKSWGNVDSTKVAQLWFGFAIEFNLMTPGTLKISIRAWNLAWQGPSEALHLGNFFLHRNRRQIHSLGDRVELHWFRANSKGEADNTVSLLNGNLKTCHRSERRSVFICESTVVFCAHDHFLLRFFALFFLCSLPILWASTFCCACWWRHLCIINCMQRIWMTWQRETKSLYTEKKCRATLEEIISRTLKYMQCVMEKITNKFKL